MDLLLPTLFVVNVILALVDASVAFHKAPNFVAALNPDPEGRAAGTRKLKSLLPLLVALYVSIDCHAYSLRDHFYLGCLTALLIGDITVQHLIARRGEDCEG